MYNSSQTFVSLKLYNKANPTQKQPINGSTIFLYLYNRWAFYRFCNFRVPTRVLDRGYLVTTFRRKVVAPLLQNDAQRATSV